MSVRASESPDASLRDPVDVANDLGVDPAVGLSTGEATRRPENRAENAVAALPAVTATRSTVLRDRALLTVPSNELVRGDILVLAPPRGHLLFVCGLIR